MGALLGLGVRALRMGSCVRSQVFRRGSCIALLLPVSLLLLRLLRQLLSGGLVAGTSLVLVKVRSAESEVGG